MQNSEFVRGYQVLGKQEVVEEILVVADLFLLPLKESFGLAALEAMACSAQVSSNAGGLPSQCSRE